MVADDGDLSFKQLQSCLKDKKQDEFYFLSGHMTGHMTAAQQRRSKSDAAHERVSDGGVKQQPNVSLLIPLVGVFLESTD